MPKLIDSPVPRADNPRLGNSLVAIISSSRKLQGKGFETGTQACDGFGLLLVATLWTGKESAYYASLTCAYANTEHFWTFSLAFATYMILIYVSGSGNLSQHSHRC